MFAFLWCHVKELISKVEFWPGGFLMAVEKSVFSFFSLPGFDGCLWRDQWVKSAQQIKGTLLIRPVGCDRCWGVIGVHERRHHCLSFSAWVFFKQWCISRLILMKQLRLFVSLCFCPRAQATNLYPRVNVELLFETHWRHQSESHILVPSASKCRWYQIFFIYLFFTLTFWLGWFCTFYFFTKKYILKKKKKLYHQTAHNTKLKYSLQKVTNLSKLLLQLI